MEYKLCVLCEKDSNLGINVLDRHLCSDCLDSINKTELGDPNYEYYKSKIACQIKQIKKI